ncbi:MAG: hypothetical protein ACRDVG_09170 [Jatrophihabitantaceae bacterium]
MTTTSSSTSDYQQCVVARDDAARSLYNAELAVHDAHQSHVDAWINAASERLHAAVVAHLDAEARLHALDAAPAA